MNKKLKLNNLTASPRYTRSMKKQQIVEPVSDSTTTTSPNTTSQYFSKKSAEPKLEAETLQVVVKKHKNPIKVEYESKPDDEKNVSKPVSQKTEIAKSEIDEKWEPGNWRVILDNILEMRKNHTAPVDSMGCHMCSDPNANPSDARFQVLVALMLSSQTKDEVTHAAMKKLKSHGCTPAKIKSTSSEMLGQLIYPVGFWRVRFVVSDEAAHILNTWSPSQQNLSHVVNGMAILGVPPPARQSGIDFSVIHGLRVAIEVLTECSEIQDEKRTSLMENASKVLNSGRVICITSARDDANMKSLENIFLSQLIQQNQNAAASHNRIPIHHCHLVILNIFPVSTSDCLVTNQLPREVSPLLTMEVHSIKAPKLHSKLSHLILSHYDLASTTVTGIPMKEEQNASSSANYDVEIFHASAAHAAIMKGNPQESVLIKTFMKLDEVSEYETVTLKWCTPRGCSASEMQNCTAMHRITPVDINSRPSSCLINFLLNGRSVMLEMARKSGGKTISHLLAAHGGEIFIHTLSTARSVLEDPPSISEGCGGRVTDYRITDFGTLMRNNMLVPLKRNSTDELQSPAAKMRSRLERHTRYWPITISSTLMFNLKQHVDPLSELMVKEELTTEEVLQCKQVIFDLLTQEAKHEALPLPSIGGGRGGKGGVRREEHYRLLWVELETFLKSHSNQSASHTEVLNCLLEVCNKDDKDKVELDQALRELDGLGKEDVMARASVIRATTDSPMSPPLCTGSSLGKQIHKGTFYAPKTLLDIWLQRSASKERKPDFHGRLNSDGFKAKLYPNLKEPGREPREAILEA